MTGREHGARNATSTQPAGGQHLRRLPAVVEKIRREALEREALEKHDKLKQVQARDPVAAATPPVIWSTKVGEDSPGRIDLGDGAWMIDNRPPSGT